MLPGPSRVTRGRTRCGPAPPVRVQLWAPLRRRIHHTRAPPAATTAAGDAGEQSGGDAGAGVGETAFRVGPVPRRVPRLTARGARRVRHRGRRGVGRLRPARVGRCRVRGGVLVDRGGSGAVAVVAEEDRVGVLTDRHGLDAGLRGPVQTVRGSVQTGVMRPPTDGLRPVVERRGLNRRNSRPAPFRGLGRRADIVPGAGRDGRRAAKIPVPVDGNGGDSSHG